MPGFPHHITQRGNNGADVFLSDDDREMYLRFIGTMSRKCGLRVVGCCLMTNHVHVIGIPLKQDSLANAIGRSHLVYTQYFNRLHGRCGHLWQNRFYSCPMDESHAWTALCYVEQNPVRAGLVREAWQYPWSSAAVHCGLGKGGWQWLDLDAWLRTWGPERWRDILRRPGDRTQTEQVRHSTRTGRPLADATALRNFEQVLARPLGAVTRGRPKGSHTPWRRNK